MYNNDFADVYDDVYRCHLDYPLLARRLSELALEHSPGARTLLDVGCGTGEHLRHLRDRFDVTGVDLSDPMLRIARAKLPGVELRHADMRHVELGRRFDVVICLYASMAYVASVEDLNAAARRLSAHLAPGGVLVVEPWAFREDWNGGDFVQATFHAPQRMVTRMGRWTTTPEGRSRVEMHYLVGDRSGVRHFVDTQELTLFSRAEYEGALTAAGCRPRLLPDAYAGRAVFVATHPPGGPR